MIKVATEKVSSFKAEISPKASASQNTVIRVLLCKRPEEIRAEVGVLVLEHV